MSRSIKVVERLAAAAAIIVVIVIAGCAVEDVGAPSKEEAQASRVAMNFDLSKCQLLEPNLYRCPGSEKSICTPGFARADVDCIKADNSGVLIQTP